MIHRGCQIAARRRFQPRQKEMFQQFDKKKVICYCTKTSHFSEVRMSGKISKLKKTAWGSLLVLANKI